MTSNTRGPVIWSVDARGVATVTLNRPEVNNAYSGALIEGVLFLRGSWHCLVGDDVKSLGTNDLVTIAPMMWHQFRASKGEPLGFLCMVNAERDKPQLPTPDDVARLRKNPAIAAFLDDRP